LSEAASKPFFVEKKNQKTFAMPGRERLRDRVLDEIEHGGRLVIGRRHGQT
jgi:hypothetical protein